MDQPVKILFYGRLAEAIAPALEFGGVAARSIGELRERLAREHPAAAEALASKRSSACVGGRIVSDDFALVAGDPVEFFPPVSGG